MGKILTFIQHQDGQVSRNSLEALKAAQELATALSHSLAGVVFGLESPPEQLTGLKLDEVLLVPATELEEYTQEQYIAAMNAVIAAESPELLLAGHTYQARDWLPRLASRLERPLVSDCVGYRLDGQVTWVRQIFQGKINADVQTTPGLAIVSFQSGAFRSDDLEPGSPTVRTLSVDLSGVTLHVRPGDRFQEGKGTVDLSHAERIVSVGRGIGDADNLHLVRELAAALDAELGSSRPVVDYGWLDHDRQVGSSGQTVSAKLYLSVGISGAIQHQVGMKNSGCIVAINKDANAPIFEIADYGIVADLFEIVPRLTAAIKEHRGT
ncbi:MAG: electron transfer flavoprotein subunit alpha/FixB family protein [Candidatus Marinimicrobia bacterium]|nr:electron transfer flavoprotein subunit alpha/FixB family protein [Candidatus Neomarinimicrobiota bacterium]